MTDILADGSGTASALPLWPLAPGYTRFYSDGTTATVLGLSQNWGTSLWRTRTIGTQGEILRFYAAESAGVFYYGATNRDGRLSRPILLVPSTVRVGMKWTARADGGVADQTSTVTKREEKSTIFGHGVVWTIETQQAVAGKAQVFSSQFVEGRGLVATEAVQVTGAIVPLSTPGGVNDAADSPLTLHAVGSGPILKGLWVDHVSAIVDAAGQTHLRLGGRFRAYQNTSGVGYFVWMDGVACGGGAAETWAFGDGKIQTPGGALDCPDALADAVPTGPVSPAFTVHGEPTGSLVGSVRGSDGETRTWQRTELNWKFMGKAVAAGGQTVLDVGDPTYSLLAFAHLTSLATVLPLEGADGADTDVALPAGDRLAAFAVRAGKATVAEAWTGKEGVLTARRDDQGREILLVGGDGRVDRVRGGGAGAHLERVATVAMPDGHDPVGAFRVQQTLYVLTSTGRGTFTSMNSGDDNSVGTTHLWQTTLPSAPPKPKGLGKTDVPQSAIQLLQVGRDLLVCWPSGLATLPAGTKPDTKWTLGGKPATGVAVDPRCLLIVRDPTVLPDKWSTGDFAAEGTIAGIGPIALAADTAHSGNVAGPPEGIGRLAPLKDGGFGGFAFRSLAGGIAWTGQPNPQLPPGQGFSVQVFKDAGGGGLWRDSPFGMTCAGPPATSCTELWNYGIGGWITFTMPSQFQGFRVGGGLVLTGGSDAGGYTPILALPGGTLDVQPALPPSHKPKAALADGTVCGLKLTFANPALFCRKPGQPVQVSPPVGDTVSAPVAAMLQDPWYPAQDGLFYYRTAEGFSYVDPESLTLHAVDLSAFAPHGPFYPGMAPAWDGNGAMFVLIQAGEAPNLLRFLLQFSGGKATAVAMPAGLDLEKVGGLLLDEHFLTLSYAGVPGDGMLRLVRP